MCPVKTDLLEAVVFGSLEAQSETLSFNFFIYWAWLRHGFTDRIRTCGCIDPHCFGPDSWSASASQQEQIAPPVSQTGNHCVMYERQEELGGDPKYLGRAPLGAR